MSAIQLREKVVEIAEKNLINSEKKSQHFFQIFYIPADLYFGLSLAEFRTESSLFSNISKPTDNSTTLGRSI